MKDLENLRGDVLSLIEENKQVFDKESKFEPGVTFIQPSGKVIGSNEVKMMIDSVLDAWLTTGRFNKSFEKKLANFLGVRNLLTTNSGSSANLLAFSALTSPLLKEKRILPGSEVITVAAGFPTTVNPIIQNKCIPVFIDIDKETHNIDVDLIEDAISEKTRAIMIAHSLGNPFKLDRILEICKKYDLWLVEDNCDALGSKYNDQFTGTFGHIGTLSFYPAHHITMGEGGAVFTNNNKLKKIIESFRDWGRDCFCEPGKDNTCGKRFDWKLGDLPYGYDHKYTYSHAGYNLKISDMQAACGLAQLDKLDYFIQKRKDNFNYLYEKLKIYSERFIELPSATQNSEPSWFGFLITVKNDSGFNRNQLTTFLNDNKIGTRLLFAGNLTKQPYLKDYEYKIFGNLKNTDLVMNNSFWIGVHPAITVPMMDYMIKKFDEFFSNL